MIKHELITPELSVFDYGCGQGDDVAALRDSGYPAFGWDPYFAPDGPRQKADIVNLGFVVNVIEDSAERIETIQSAWSFARLMMSVAVMVTRRGNRSERRPFKDGVLTSRRTFQKYFQQREIFALLQKALNETPVALGPGIFVVFRDKALEKKFLLAHRSRGLILDNAPEIDEATSSPYGLTDPNSLSATPSESR